MKAGIAPLFLIVGAMFMGYAIADIRGVQFGFGASIMALGALALWLDHKLK
jgi:hypothetical protein